MEKETTCCFTGHRRIEKHMLGPLQKQLKTEISRLISEGYVTFSSGGALGFDIMAAQTVIQLKKKHPHIRLSMVLPCKEQDRNWSEEQRLIYRKVLYSADEITYTAETYHKGCMHKRNRYLVDSASYMIAYLIHDRGGTKYTVDYADRSGIPIVFLRHKIAWQLSLFS